MTESERITDILSAESHGIERDELELLYAYILHENYFKSIEYYQIVHYTDAELYYSSEEEFLNECADLILDTEKGRIFLFS